MPCFPVQEWLLLFPALYIQDMWNNLEKQQAFLLMAVAAVMWEALFNTDLGKVLIYASNFCKINHRWMLRHQILTPSMLKSEKKTV